MKDIIAKEISEQIEGKRVALFWSGGFESNYLLKLMLENELYKLCSLEVVSILFPQDVYDREKMGRVKQWLRSHNIGAHFYYPETVMERDISSYGSACLKCKSVRREAIHTFLESQKKNSPMILMTGHNVDDVASYMLENIAVTLDCGKIANRSRFLETTNKFLPVFEHCDSLTVFRPLLRYSKKLLEQDSFGQWDEWLFDITVKCYWANQRKRILQHYLTTSGIEPNFDRAYSAFLKLFSLPTIEEFRTLPIEIYLM